MQRASNLFCLRGRQWFAMMLGLASLHSGWANGQARGVVPPEPPSIDALGNVHVPSIVVPLSPLASQEAKSDFLNYVRNTQSPCVTPGDSNDIVAFRKRLDDCLNRPAVARLRAVFPVSIKPQRIAGVMTDVIEPSTGVAERNRRRVLINLHDGFFLFDAGLGGQLGSIPVASSGAIKVISIDYREAPENKFPAASEDVAAVYRQLLKEYPAKNIGLYGCSAGGVLTAESVAWFHSHNLPNPGAIGIFGAGALVPWVGDSSYVGPLLTGSVPNAQEPNPLPPYFDVPRIDIHDSLVSPVYHPSVLATFPPTLVLSGTRDIGLSTAVYTHAQLSKAGVDAVLHVWEGAAHCTYTHGDPDVPETRDAWRVIAEFFDRHLGT